MQAHDQFRRVLSTPSHACPELTQRKEQKVDEAFCVPPGFINTPLYPNRRRAAFDYPNGYCGVLFGSDNAMNPRRLR